VSVGPRCTTVQLADPCSFLLDGNGSGRGKSVQKGTVCKLRFVQINLGRCQDACLSHYRQFEACLRQAWAQTKTTSPIGEPGWLSGRLSCLCRIDLTLQE
jgi:hypothetical protein